MTAREKGNDPFVELLAADTLSVARNAQPVDLLPNNKLYYMAGAGFACLAVLAWLIVAGPSYLGYGASLLWTGPEAVPLYDIKVNPGDVAVRRNSDQLVIAQLIGLKPEKVRLFARYKSSGQKMVGNRSPCSVRILQTFNSSLPLSLKTSNITSRRAPSPRATTRCASGSALSQADACDLPLPQVDRDAGRSPKNTVAICAPWKALTRS